MKFFVLMLTILKDGIDLLGGLARCLSRSPRGDSYELHDFESGFLKNFLASVSIIQEPVYLVGCGLQVLFNIRIWLQTTTRFSNMAL